MRCYPNVTTLWTEPFTYANGPLTGNGGWVAQPGFPDPYVIAGNEATVDAGTGAWNQIDLSSFGADFNGNFVASAEISIPSGAIAYSGSQDYFTFGSDATNRIRVLLNYNDALTSIGKLQNINIQNGASSVTVAAGADFPLDADNIVTIVKNADRLSVIINGTIVGTRTGVTWVTVDNILKITSTRNATDLAGYWDNMSYGQITAHTP